MSGLSSWPDKSPSDKRKSWKQAAEVHTHTLVTLEFDEEVYVCFESDAAIGIKLDPESARITAFLPKSQIVGNVPEKGTYFTTIRIPRWLAEEKKLTQYVVEDDE